ncbi:uncharacterized protein LOC128232037 [Mya arenaria]|uniref:uncharacterized protein LOC128232037 n=1 Tax=Mya arenaria TaxID=6604 RepID=UPI0022E966F8|nr:uncharacterized protein LOC128232037 [Mya arenaria]
MGVTQLWQVLGPVEEHLPLSSLCGQTLAVDLSIWVCETQCVKQMQGVVSKPFLRNLFFRISHLSQLGVKLVFVIEGSAPELKWDTMMKRQQARFPGRQGKPPGAKPGGTQNRRNFNACLRECCELLDILGIPYLQSRGEAEAMCALLNAAGLVDGCLTNDGDAFLYGAKTVYRNFTMNTKDPHVEMFRTCDIEKRLGITHSGLVALGLLVGCDFVPKGVPGIGVANAVRLLQSLAGRDVIQRMREWRSMSESACLDQVEQMVRRKALDVPDFPQDKVIKEFLVAKDRCPTTLSPWKRPLPAKLQDFALVKLDWPAEYTLEKVLPLTTLWDMQDILSSQNPSRHQHLKPFRIVKTRVRQGEPCYEIEWYKPVTVSQSDGSYYVTIENQEMFAKCYPDVVDEFALNIDTKKKVKGKKKKKKGKDKDDNLDNISFNFQKMNLKEVTTKLTESAKCLPQDFDIYNESSLLKKAKQPKHLTLDSVSNKPQNNVTSKSTDSSKSKKACIANEPHGAKPLKKESAQDGYIPLSQRVKMRLQSKSDRSEGGTLNTPMQLNTGSKKDLNSDNAEWSDMSSLIEEVGNLSLQQNKKQGLSISMSSPAVNTKFPMQFSPAVSLLSKPGTPSNLDSKKYPGMQKMSSPALQSFCTPTSYMKQSMAADDSFGMKCSPVLDPGLFKKPRTYEKENKIETNNEMKLFETSGKLLNNAEKLAAKLEQGIMNVGKEAPSEKKFSFFDNDKPEVQVGKSGDDKQIDKAAPPVSNLSTPTSNMQTKRNTASAMQTPFNLSSLGLDMNGSNQFGNFDMQTSLINSLCSSLVQALTPKGISLSKEDYSTLLSTLDELDANETGTKTPKATERPEESDEDTACNIYLSDIEKASAQLKKMNASVTLDPIRLVGEQQIVENIETKSKSARKKLRRKEKKRALEDIAQLNNMALNMSQNNVRNPKTKVLTEANVKSANKSAENVHTTQINSRKTSAENVKTTLNNSRKTSAENVKTTLNNSRKTSAENVKTTLNNSRKTSAENVKTAQSNKRASQISVTDNAKKVIDEKGEKLDTPQPINGSQKKKKVKHTEPIPSCGKSNRCTGSQNCSKQNKYEKETCCSGDQRKSENTKPRTEKQSLAPFTVSTSPCPVTSPRKENDKKQVYQKSNSEICRNIFSAQESEKISKVLGDVLNEQQPRSVDTSEEVVKKKKKKKKVKKASTSADENMANGLCASYLQMALENNREKVTNIQKASPVFDLSADESLLELENISSKVVGEAVDAKKVTKLSLLRKMKKLTLERRNSPSTVAITDKTPVFCMSAETMQGGNDNTVENDKEACLAGVETDTPVEIDGSVTDENKDLVGNSADIHGQIQVQHANSSSLPKFEDILDTDEDECIQSDGNSDSDDVKLVTGNEMFTHIADNIRKELVEQFVDLETQHIENEKVKDDIENGTAGVIVLESDAEMAGYGSNANLPAILNTAQHVDSHSFTTEHGDITHKEKCRISTDVFCAVSSAGIKKSHDVDHDLPKFQIEAVVVPTQGELLDAFRKQFQPSSEVNFDKSSFSEINGKICNGGLECNVNGNEKIVEENPLFDENTEKNITTLDNGIGAIDVVTNNHVEVKEKCNGVDEYQNENTSENCLVLNGAKDCDAFKVVDLVKDIEKSAIDTSISNGNVVENGCNDDCHDAYNDYDALEIEDKEESAVFVVNENLAENGANDDEYNENVVEGSVVCITNEYIAENGYKSGELSPNGTKVEGCEDIANDCMDVPSVVNDLDQEVNGGLHGPVKDVMTISTDNIASPACLADRLKMRISKSKVRNVLDSFTNNRFDC